jgi:hypothetical protein
MIRRTAIVQLLKDQTIFLRMKFLGLSLDIDPLEWRRPSWSGANWCELVLHSTAPETVTGAWEPSDEGFAISCAGAGG